MTQSIWQHSVREPELTADIAVIGGGIIGASTAYWISRLDPDRNVALVEAGALASGASGRNAGFLLQGARSDYLLDCQTLGRPLARKLWRFTRSNRDLIFSELDASDFALEPSGSLIVAGTPEEDERLRDAVSIMRADGAAAKYFFAEDTNKRLASNDFLGSLYVPSGAMLHPARLIRHLVDRSGAQVSEYTRVQEVRMGPSGVHIESDRRPLRADRVVLAVNAWLPQLFPALAPFVRPVRAQMLASRPFARRWLNLPIYTHDGFYYVRQTKSGVLLAGGARHLHEQEEVGYADEVTGGVQGAIERYLDAHFPRVSTMKVDRRWSGVMGFSPDHLPVVGEVPDVPGSYWAAGFSGHGMGYGFRFGKMLAELALGNDRPDELDLFTANRFTRVRGKQAVSA